MLLLQNILQDIISNCRANEDRLIEGRFILQDDPASYSLPMKYANDDYPGNPNGSDLSAASFASKDGRHLAMMPHLERSIFPWNWPHYDKKLEHEVSPWIVPFINAKKWVEEN